MSTTLTIQMVRNTNYVLPITFITPLICTILLK